MHQKQPLDAGRPAATEKQSHQKILTRALPSELRAAGVLGQALCQKQEQRTLSTLQHQLEQGGHGCKDNSYGSRTLVLLEVF